ncbi:hypothetical protein Gotur_031002 [Gossypium turneri]
MFMGIVATGDKAWAPSSGTLRSGFFENGNNKTPEENEEENMRNDVHILNDVHISNDVQIDGKVNWRGCKIVQPNRKIMQCS